MRQSLLVLLIVNLIPLVGVLAFDWNAASVLGVYWVETLVIGGYTVLKILTSRPENGPARFGTAFFFTLHFGVFAFVHGTFLRFLLGFTDSAPARESVSPVDHLFAFVHDLWVHGEGIQLAFLGLLASHGASVVLNFWLGGERQNADLKTLMFAPYPRIVTMHVTILAGGLLATRTGEPFALLIALVVAKTALDAYGHLRERRKLAGLPDRELAP